MASIVDRWYAINPATGKRDVPKPRCGQGSRWLVKWLDPDGAPKTKAFPRKPDAERFMVTVAADVWRGDYIDPDAGRETFGSFGRAWLASRLVNPSSHERESGIFRRQLEPRFGKIPLVALRPSMVREWVKARSAEVAQSTMRAELHVLAAICKAAVEDDLLRKSPCGPVKIAKPERVKVEPWSPEVVLKLIAAHDERYRPVPWLAAAAGLRQGEAFGVSPDDVDFLRRELHVRRQVKVINSRSVFAPPKRNSVGVVPIPAELTEILAEHIRRFPPVDVTLDGVTVPLLVTTPRGRPLARGAYNEGQWHRALATTGLERAGKASGFHMLRHHYASSLIDAGEPLTVVQARLRHGSLKETVETYSHLMPGTEDRTRKAVTSALFRASQRDEEAR